MVEPEDVSMSLFKNSMRAAAVLVCLLFLALGARAQYRGGLQGAVLDAQGGTVSGAKVTVTAQETNESQVVTSDSNGVYALTRLAPGLYTITVEKPGFKKQVISDVNILVETPTALNLALEIGDLTQEVRVNGDLIAAIDTESGNISGTVTADQIQKMPSFNRDVFQLLQLAPGAFGDGAHNDGGGTQGLPSNEQAGTSNTDGIFKTENGNQISVGGGRTNANNIQIDGVGVTSVSWGGSSVITPNEDSVKEVKVVTENYDAENGRFAGGQVQIISANGTNDFHGSAFIKIDRPGLNSTNGFHGPFNANPQKNQGRFNQIGGSISGPIWKNKIFFDFTYETIRNSSTTTSSGWYETPQLLTMAPAGSIASRFTTFPGTAVSSTSIGDNDCTSIGLAEGPKCHKIPGKGLDIGSPLKGVPLGTMDPTWTSTMDPGVGSGLDGIADLQFVNTASPSDTTEVQYHGRLDWNITSKDLIAFSIYRVPVSSNFFNGPSRPVNFYHHSAINEAETVLWDHTFSPTLVNEVRANAAGWRWNEIASNSQQPWGLPNANFDTLGTITPNDFGAPGPSVFDQWTYGAKDVLTKIYNSHTLKFGGEYTRLLFVDEAPWSARPSYNFHNYWDFLNDAPFVENGTFDPTTGIPASFRKDTRTNIVAVFVQDNYKVKPNLTLTFGMRWEYFGPLTEKNGNFGVVTLGTGSALLTGMTVKRNGTLYNTSANNWGPQLGFAWSPKGAFNREFNSHLVLRGGFGIGYNGLEEAITLNGRNNPPFVSQNMTLMGSQILYAVPANIHQFSPYPANPFAISPFGTNGLPLDSIVSVTAYPNDLPTSYTYHYSFEAQYDLGHQWVATVGYQGSQSRHLTRQYNLNLFYSQQLALNPAVNSVDAYANDANANFNALLTEIHHQFAKTFELDGQYRYAKSRDQGSNNFSVDNFQFNPALAWGPSDFDVTHAFKVYGIWSPVIFHGDHSWMEKIAGGWTISGIFNAHSGFPFNPNFNAIPTGDPEKPFFNLCDAIYVNGSCQNGTNSSLRPAAYLGGAGSNYSNSGFEKAGGNFPKGGFAYFTPPSFTPGPNFPNVGPLPGVPGVSRNAFRGPRFMSTDATLSKSFGLPRIKYLGENAKLEIRGNFYNLFNDLNLTNVDATINDTNFGRAQNALGGRTIEVQGRFSF
jgi:hypothetical protein